MKNMNIENMKTKIQVMFFSIIERRDRVFAWHKTINSMFIHASTNDSADWTYPREGKIAKRSFPDILILHKYFF